MRSLIMLNLTLLLSLLLVSDNAFADSSKTKQQELSSVKVEQPEQKYRLEVIWEEPENQLILNKTNSAFSCFDFKSKMMINGVVLRNICPHFMKNVHHESFSDRETRSAKFREKIEFSWMSSVSRDGRFVAETLQDGCGRVFFNSDVESAADGLEAFSKEGCRVSLTLTQNTP